MMTKQTAAAVEQIRRSVKVLRAIADNTADWQDAEAIHAEADRLVEQIDALELDARPECTEGELLTIIFVLLKKKLDCWYLEDRLYNRKLRALNAAA